MKHGSHSRHYGTTLLCFVVHDTLHPRPYRLRDTPRCQKPLKHTDSGFCWVGAFCLQGQNRALAWLRRPQQPDAEHDHSKGENHCADVN